MSWGWIIFGCYALVVLFSLKRFVYGLIRSFSSGYVIGWDDVIIGCLFGFFGAWIWPLVWAIIVIGSLANNDPDNVMEWFKPRRIKKQDQIQMQKQRIKELEREFRIR